MLNFRSKPNLRKTLDKSRVVSEGVIKTVIKRKLVNWLFIIINMFSNIIAQQIIFKKY